MLKYEIREKYRFRKGKKKEKNTIKMNSVLLSDDQSNHHFF
jgi:hypothetical protein